MDAELRRRLTAGPGEFAHMLDLTRDRLLLVTLSEEEIRRASFLDQRVLTPQTPGGWLPLDAVEAALDGATMRDDAQTIFHIGHVGSTLIARLLGELPGVLALREPLVLRGIAEAAATLDRPESPWEPARYRPRVALLRRLLARTFRPGQRAIVKATSFTSEVAADLVPPGSRVLFLYVSPESYAATILAGNASRVELAALSGTRLQRLHRRLGGTPWRLWALDEAERVALGWATEMSALLAAETALPSGSVLWVDFDRFLAAPAAALGAIAAHFGEPLDEAQARALVGGPIMQRYAKGPEHAYTPALRAQVLAQARGEYGAAIARARAWLDRAAGAQAVIAAALDRGAR